MAEEYDKTAFSEGEPPAKATPPAPKSNPDQAMIWVVLLALMIGCFLLIALCLLSPTIFWILGIRIRVH